MLKYLAFCRECTSLAPSLSSYFASLLFGERGPNSDEPKKRRLPSIAGAVRSIIGCLGEEEEEWIQENNLLLKMSQHSESIDKVMEIYCIVFRYLLL